MEYNFNWKLLRKFVNLASPAGSESALEQQRCEDAW